MKSPTPFSFPSVFLLFLNPSLPWLQALARQKAALEKLGEEEFPPDLEQYYRRSVEALELSHQVQSAVLNSNASNKVLTEGRVVVINSPLYRNALAVILRTIGSSGGSKHDAARGLNTTLENDRRFMVLVLTEAAEDGGTSGAAGRAAAGGKKKKAGAKEAAANTDLPLPFTVLAKPQTRFGWAVAEINGLDIICITPERIQISGKEVADSRNTTAQSTAAQQLWRLAHSFPGRPPSLDPVRDMNLRQLDVAEAFLRLTEVTEELQSMSCVDHPDFIALYGKLHERMRLQQQVSSIEWRLEKNRFLQRVGGQSQDRPCVYDQRRKFCFFSRLPRCSIKSRTRRCSCYQSTSSASLC